MPHLAVCQGLPYPHAGLLLHTCHIAHFAFALLFGKARWKVPATLFTSQAIYLLSFAGVKDSTEWMLAGQPTQVSWRPQHPLYPFTKPMLSWCTCGRCWCTKYTAEDNCMNVSLWLDIQGSCWCTEYTAEDNCMNVSLWLDIQGSSNIIFAPDLEQEECEEMLLSSWYWPRLPAPISRIASPKVGCCHIPRSHQVLHAIMRLHRSWACWRRTSHCN